MSVAASSLIWKSTEIHYADRIHRLTAPEKIILLRLADFHSEDHAEVYCSGRRLARETGMTLFGVQRIIQRLIDCHAIAATNHPKGKRLGINTYVLLLANYRPLQVVTLTTSSGHPLTTSGGHPRPPQVVTKRTTNVCLNDNGNVSAAAGQISESKQIAKLAGLLPITLDDDATANIWRKCRERVPDITPEEIAEFAGRKLSTHPTGGLTNPAGYLIRVLPAAIVPSSVRQLREQIAARQVREEEDRRQREKDDTAHQDAKRAAQDRLAALDESDKKSLRDRWRADVMRGISGTWHPGAEEIERMIDTRILRDFYERELAKRL